MSDLDSEKSAERKRDIAVTLLVVIPSLTALFTYREIRGDISLFEHYLVVAVLIIVAVLVTGFLSRRT